MDAPARDRRRAAAGPSVGPATDETEMNNVQGINPSWAPKPIEPAAPVAPGLAARAPAEIADVVEISTASMLAAKIHEVPGIRAELVARVKAEIQAGTYETPERLDAAVDGLMKDLFPELL